MSRFSRESWRLALGRRSLEVSCRPRGASDWQVRAAVAIEFGVTPSADDDATVLEAMRALVETHIPARTTVATMIRDECARYAVVDPPVNARRPSELRFAAAARMKALFGDAAADWIVEADWSATRRFLACAVPASMVRVALRCLAEAGRRDGGTSTEFVTAWNAHYTRMPTADAWVVHAGRGAVVIAACEDAGISRVSMRRHDGDLAIDDAMAEIRRCALRWNLPAPATTYLLGAGFPDAAGARRKDGVVELPRSLPLTGPGGPVAREAVA